MIKFDIKENWYTFSEAAIIWNLYDGSTLRRAVKAKRFKPSEFKKIGNTYIVSERGMNRLYGDRKWKDELNCYLLKKNHY